jgi:tripartite-type tricarboxylate transporter receptor subunit TctC
VIVRVPCVANAWKLTSRLPFAGWSLLSQGVALLVAVALSLASGPSGAQSAAWPTKPIRIVVAYPAGGTTDIAARLLAERLSRTIGQQVIVENRGGAGGTIGALSVVRAEPDGYTILLAASPEVSIAPTTVKSMAYDPVKDLQPISLVGQVPFFLVANPGFPPNTVAELIAYAKANPGKVNYSSFGNNTSNHLVGELFKSAAGIEAVHVPYKGSGPSITDLIGGQIQYTFDTPAATLAQVKGGKLKAIAVATPQRLVNASTVPTMGESGLPGFVGGTWFGLLAPAKTPRAVIDKLNAETVAALSSPELRKAFEERDILPSGNSPEEFGRFIQSEVNKWRDLAAKVGIVPE